MPLYLKISHHHKIRISVDRVMRRRIIDTLNRTDEMMPLYLNWGDHHYLGGTAYVSSCWILLRSIQNIVERIEWCDAFVPELGTSSNKFRRTTQARSITVAFYVPSMGFITSSQAGGEMMMTLYLKVCCHLFVHLSDDVKRMETLRIFSVCSIQFSSFVLTKSKKRRKYKANTR